MFATVHVTDDDVIFSSSEQRSGRAIVLPPASALALAFALALASTNVKSFTLKFLGPHYFQTLSMDLVHVWCDDRYLSKILHSAISTPIHDFMVKVTDGLRTYLLKFCVKVLRNSLFPNPMMDLVCVWYDNRYWSKILHNTIPTPIHDLKVKVTDLELSC